MKRMMVVLTTVLLIADLSGAMAAAQTVTLTFWGWIGPEWIETYREFERQHPNIKIKESLISQEWASSSEKFLAAMAAEMPRTSRFRTPTSSPSGLPRGHFSISGLMLSGMELSGMTGLLPSGTTFRQRPAA